MGHFADRSHIFASKFDQLELPSQERSSPTPESDSGMIDLDETAVVQLHHERLERLVPNELP